MELNHKEIQAQCERIIALMAIIAISPALLLVACLIRYTSCGPVLYVQSRPGLNGRSFRLYKFRTMHVGADRENARARKVSDDDEMITSVGRILRRLKIDELPQLWNVVRGEMSIVGPRPIAWSLHTELTKTIPMFEERLKVRPGITSLAQLEAIDSDDQQDVLFDWRRRFAIESNYIPLKSMRYDVAVVFLTICYIAAKVVRATKGTAVFRLLRSKPVATPKAYATLSGRD
jgi:lipopolysaccharide/colanic/teichoic acid biosynthesis glycosyltransferase